MQAEVGMFQGLVPYTLHVLAVFLITLAIGVVVGRWIIAMMDREREEMRKYLQREQLREDAQASLERYNALRSREIAEQIAQKNDAWWQQQSGNRMR